MSGRVSQYVLPPSFFGAIINIGNSTQTFDKDKFLIVSATSKIVLWEAIDKGTLKHIAKVITHC